MKYLTNRILMARDKKKNSTLDNITNAFTGTGDFEGFVEIWDNPGEINNNMPQKNTSFNLWGKNSALGDISYSTNFVSSDQNITNGNSYW